MFKNYLTIALRNLSKNRFSSIINIGGLSIGMAVAMLIGLWVHDELSFDTNFKNYQRIAQVMQHAKMNGETVTGIAVPFLMGETLKRTYPADFKYSTMSTWSENHILALGEKKISKPGRFLEPDALDMLDIKMLKGVRKSLNEPYSVFLSASSAKALFGNEDPMGKTIKLDNRLDVKLTGIYEDLPFSSSFADLQFIAPWELFVTSQGLRNSDDPWRCNCYLNYVQVADGRDMKKLSAKIKNIKRDKVNRNELTQEQSVFLQPMSKWHLYPDFKNGINLEGKAQNVWLFAMVGAFVLLLACINFMNLSTARSERRAKEVGIRKSVGSMRRQLITQFFVESCCIAALSFGFSLALVQLTLPLFNEIAEKKISIPSTQPLFWLQGIVFCLFTGLIAGSYPALYLSAFRPVKVLKGNFKTGRFAALPRKVLVVLQFCISVFLIIATAMVFRQVRFAKSRPLGYDRNGLITIPMITSDLHDHFEVVKNELVKNGAIANMAEAGSPTTAVWSTNAGFDWKGKDPRAAVEIPNIDVSYDYGKTVGWQFIEGRDFSKDFPTDSAAFVVNESAVKFMGFKEPVGETVRWDGKPYRIIGVIRDMLIESPYAPVRPTFFHLSPYQGSVLIAKLSPSSDIKRALSKMETVFKKYNPSQPFDFRFVDEDHARKFGDEEKTGKLSCIFTVLAIFISCLGLFGMASFIAEKRTKEIGIRKVLGATVYQLWQLLCRDFVLLVMIALLIASPLAYYFMHSWLQNYAYHAALAWWIFAGTAVLAILISLFTVSVQAIRAATTNPVRNLRTE
ncbi:MAG TPA: ABC transporter permease [Flavisolibacter sp.]|nr:ABC transporter permease [Flavisolibacter sp.]